MVTINSDDPAYFGGYLNENFIAVTESLKLIKKEICKLAENSFTASFLDEQSKENWISKVKEYYKKIVYI